MFEHGVTRAGPLRIPARPQLALDFLEEQRTTIQHYGVEIDGLRYNGDGLNGHRNQPSPYRGVDAGKWPIAIDSGDITKVYFQDPKTRQWHILGWEHAPALKGPVSREAMVYARRLAGKTHRFPDSKRALVELLQRHPGHSITQLIDKWDIPRHAEGYTPPRRRPDPFADLGVELSPAMLAICTRKNALQALRNAVRTPGFRTRRAASIAFGTPAPPATARSA